jgi:dihydropteroate synthase
MYTINCKGNLITTDTPLIMGIINATPDSFYKGDLGNGLEGIVAIAKKMLQDGASILDIGGQSTKPNATSISVQEELIRVIPAIEIVHEKFPEAIISVDTFNSKVALAAVEAGASMVNDVSGGEMDTDMIAAVGAMKNIPYVCMHMRGTAATMQTQTNYDDINKELLEYFIPKMDVCKKAGIKDLIIDPGFGFAKTIEQNFTLLKDLAVFKILDRPILLGVSRKSSIYKTLGITAAEALNGTSVLNTLAVQNGANILRVHDVKEAVEVVKLMSAYVNSK